MRITIKGSAKMILYGKIGYLASQKVLRNVAQYSNVRRPWGILVDFINFFKFINVNVDVVYQKLTKKEWNSCG